MYLDVWRLILLQTTTTGSILAYMLVFLYIR